MSGVVARYIEDEGLGGAERVLVVDDDDGAIERAVLKAGASRVAWRRMALGGRSASPWPPEVEVDLAILRLPRDWASFEMHLHAVLGRLRRGGRLWVVGSNDEGIKSAVKRMSPLLGEVETAWIKARARILSGTVPEGSLPAPASLRVALSDWREERVLELPGLGPTTLSSYPGLFAQGALDEGTALLLSHLPEIAPGQRVLDYGCGPGTIGRAVSLKQPAARIYGCDVDAVAVQAARENLPGAQILLGDGWGAVEMGARFDLILSNPPLHRGQAEDRAALEALIQQAPLRLIGHGRLVLVTWRTANAAALLRQSMGSAELLAEDRRFQVLSARAR